MLQDLTTDVDLSPDISHLVIEDDTPVDNLISEKQMRLLTEPLYSNLTVLPTEKFLVSANVGVFHALKQPPLVPDVFLSLEVEIPADWREKKDRTYLVWEFGKPPDVVIEIVFNREGNELGSKLTDYARMGVGYYVVYDPLQQLGTTLLRAFERCGNHYHELPNFWLEAVGVGLTLWVGEFEGKSDQWLRWCTQDGGVIPTGLERAEQACNRAEQAEAKAARLAAQLRSLGVEPDV